MSPHTVCSYRDACTLLLRFLSVRHRRAVVKLDFDDMLPDDIIAFLHHLEKERGNGAATRNARLAAIHAFARFVATNHPEHLEFASGSSRSRSSEHERVSWSYFEAAEIAAFLDAPDPTTSDGAAIVLSC